MSPLDIHIQATSPGQDKEANRLPAPARGEFNIVIRSCWQKKQVLDNACKNRREGAVSPADGSCPPPPHRRRPATVGATWTVRRVATDGWRGARLTSLRR